jgi:hypothetical protein
VHSNHQRRERRVVGNQSFVLDTLSFMSREDYRVRIDVKGR